MKYVYFTLIAFASLLAGCFREWTPFADIENIGTVVSPTNSISITNELGVVTSEYIAPTKRRIWINDEYRDIDLRKSSIKNEIYTERCYFFHPPMGKIRGIGYTEGTMHFQTQDEWDRYTQIDSVEVSEKGKLLIYFEEEGGIIFLMIHKGEGHRTAQ